MATVDLAFLIIYATLLLATVAILLLHGLQRLAQVGWGYLAIFCGLKVASSALQVWGTNTTTAAAVFMCSIGLVFLTLAVAFVLHTGLSYAYSSGPAARSPTHRTFNRILACVFQLLGMIALGLLSAGSWELATTTTDTTTKTTAAPPPRRNPHRHESYAGAGAMVLILSAGALCMVAVQGYRGVGRDGQAGADSYDREEDQGMRDLGGKVVVVPRRERLGARLVLAAGTAAMVLAARVAGGMDWFFGDGQGGNPVTGAMPRRLATGMVPEGVVVVVLVVGGLSTWDIAW